MSKPFVDMGTIIRPDEDGKVSLDKSEGSGHSAAEDFAKRARVNQRDIDENMSPPGGLGLSEKLEKRRHDYQMVDQLFEVCASFDTILVWQIPYREQTYKGTKIVIPDIARKKQEQETPVGIIVSAGLGALDVMVSHGYEVGDKIYFVKQGMWRLPVGRVGGAEQYLMVLSIGDIRSNQDHWERIRKGELRYEWSPDDQKHFVVTKDGHRYEPKTPFIGADYES